MQGLAAHRPAVGDSKSDFGFLGCFLDGLNDGLDTGLGAIDDERETADGHE